MVARKQLRKKLLQRNHLAQAFCCPAVARNGCGRTHIQLAITAAANRVYEVTKTHAGAL